MINCELCIDKTSDEVCHNCRQMRSFGEWIYELDNGTRMCKCPECGRRMMIGLYRYSNPYKFCPYCGRKNIKHEQITWEAIEC